MQCSKLRKVEDSGIAKRVQQENNSQVVVAVEAN